MGYSNDGFPYVGPLKKRVGQYLCAGFSGHGMPQIFLAAKAIATMIIHGDETKVDLPLPYRTSAVRMQEPEEHVSLKLWQKFASSQPARAML
jgi:glycine/D-amino acid oxidase-like deaminating enzyme